MSDHGRVVRRRGPLLVAAIVGLSLVPCRAAEPSARRDLTDLRGRALRAAKSRTAMSAERTALVAELADCGTVPEARLICRVGLAAADAGPRSAAREALVRLAADGRIRSALLADHQVATARSDPLAGELAVVLLGAEADEPRGEFRTALDRTPPEAMLPTAAGICAAARRADDAIAVAALQCVATSRCFSGSLACRRGVIATLAEMRDPAAIDVLVDMMQGLRGEARGDVIAHLAGVSGEHHGTDAKAWRAWLDGSRGAGGREETPGVGEATKVDSQSAYYDIPIYADRVVFVLDTSGSMEGLRLQAAKRELEATIAGLPDTTLFTVVTFNNELGRWQRQLVPATQPNKRAAADFVARLHAEGATATSDALEAAFAFDTEAIFLLSDGMPSAGRVVEPAAIVNLVTRINASRGVSVHTISMMGPAGFLEALAKANHGNFRAVAD